MRGIGICGIMVTMQVLLKRVACVDDMSAVYGFRFLVAFPLSVAIVCSRMLDYNPVLNAGIPTLRKDGKKIYVGVLNMMCCP